MADCLDFLTMTTQMFSRDPSRLYGPIADALRTSVPYMSVLNSGTFPAAVAATLVAPLQLRALLSNSLANPSFTSMINMCGSVDVPVDQNGTNQYQYVASIAEGMSDKICMNQGFSAYVNSLTSQLTAYQSGITDFMNADVRWQLFTRSGVKAVVQSGTAPAAMITGGEYQIDVAVPAVEADAGLNFSTLQAFNRYMRSTLRATPFGSGANAHSRVIASSDELDILRDDLGAAAGPGGGNIVPLGQLAAGGNRMATEAISGYMFEPLYRGMQFGEDTMPLRLNWNGSSYDPVNPVIPYSGTVGTGATVSPDWVEASHEVAFMFFKGSFERQVPAPWTGEGKVRFARQMFGGEIQFKNYPDLKCNLWEDWGVMAWRVGRAYKPIYPWFVLPIIYKRCLDTNTPDACTGVSG